jgi:NADH-quinone oxidoreductase subunit E
MCGILGGDEIFAQLSEHLDVGHNETTADGTVTLEHAECLAACDYAPVVTVNYEFFDQQSPESALRLVTDLQAGRRPQPTRGAPLCTFRQIERLLAGYGDPRPEAVAGGPVGEPTRVGVLVAAERGESAPAYPQDQPQDQPQGRTPGAGKEG